MLTNELTGVAAKGQYVFLQDYLLRLPYTLVALAAAVYLWFAHKEIRWKLLFPLLLVTLMISTPWAYQYSFNRYFRLFWLLPRGILTAMAATDLFRRFKNQWIRLAALLLAGGVIFLTGTSWFSDSSVEPAYTPYKIHKGLPEICEQMLTETPHPKAIFTGTWAPLMVRQYSADIELLWGRNAYGFIMPLSKEAKAVYKSYHTSPRNWDALFAYASGNGYDYIGTTSKAKALKDAAKVYGYKRIMTAGDYKLYARKDRPVSE